MTTSYNGWSASPTLALRPLVIDGEAFVPGVRDDDDVWTVLNFVAEQMNERVERIWAPGWHEMDDWGFNYRETRGENSMSCHASGTAIDYNATRHPRLTAASRTFTPAQITEIRKIVEEAGVIRWGGEWENVPDPMHFEIMGTKEEVAAAAARIRNRGKDWFDMADKEDLRAVVREEVERIWAEQIDVKRGDNKTKVSRTQALKEIFNKTVGGR